MLPGRKRRGCLAGMPEKAGTDKGDHCEKKNKNSGFAGSRRFALPGHRRFFEDIPGCAACYGSLPVPAAVFCKRNSCRKRKGIILQWNSEELFDIMCKKCRVISNSYTLF